MVPEDETQESRARYKSAAETTITMRQEVPKRIPEDETAWPVYLLREPASSLPQIRSPLPTSQADRELIQAPTASVH